MQEYEIRILRSTKHTTIIFPSGQPSDDVAVLVARRLSGNDGFEVWRELECVCRVVPGIQPDSSGRVTSAN
jgi:hypothetical protein